MWVGRVGSGSSLCRKPADEYAQILHLVGLGRPPYLAQQLAMGQHLAGMHDEMAQQVELLRRQFDLVAAARDLPAHQIDASDPPTQRPDNSPCA